jgi:hypothetical protein
MWCRARGVNEEEEQRRDPIPSIASKPPPEIARQPFAPPPFLEWRAIQPLSEVLNVAKGHSLTAIVSLL